MRPAEHPAERVELQLELGRVDEAVRDARTLVAADPGDPRSLTTLARALLAADDVAGAERAASSALAIAPESIAARAASLRAAMAADARGLRTVRRWRRTISERADLLAPAAAVDAGMAFLTSRGFALALRMKDARAAAETARKLAPDQVWGSLALAALALDRRRPGAARKHVADVLRMEPDNRWAHAIGAEVGMGPVRQVEHMRSAARAGDEQAGEANRQNSAVLSGQLLPVVGTLVFAWIGWIVALETASALGGLATVAGGAIGVRILTNRLRRTTLRGLGSAGQAIVLRSARKSVAWAVVGTLIVAAFVLQWGLPADRQAATARAALWAEARAEDPPTPSTVRSPEPEGAEVTIATGEREPAVTEEMVATALAERHYLVGLAALLALVAVSLPLDAWLLARRQRSANPRPGAA